MMWAGIAQEGGMSLCKGPQFIYKLQQ
jgi:hypothetical protein